MRVLRAIRPELPTNREILAARVAARPFCAGKAASASYPHRPRRHT